jgi:hypothetical protein
MSEVDKVLPSHLHRLALVYVRQSSQAQVEHNRESTLRQYALTERAAALGWPAARITVIDDDLGLLAGVNYLVRPATTILAGGAGEFIDGQSVLAVFSLISFSTAVWQAKRVRP